MNMDSHTPKNINRNLTVIIREANERTLPLCRELLESEVGKDRVIVVSEVPFTKALKRTYEIAIERGSSWTLVVDADVLIREGAIEYLLRVAESVDSNVFEIQGNVLDKLIGGPRDGGIHLYRTACLHQAITKIPPDKEAVRPEFDTIKEMRRQGFPFLNLDYVVGLHDYEQHFCDVYRKAFFHAHKHKREMVYWESMWRNLIHCDDDYKVALKGAIDGKEYSVSVFSDVRLFHSVEFDKVLNGLGLEEKSELPSNYWSLQDVASIVRNHFPSPDYWAWRSMSRNETKKRLTPWEKMHVKTQESGLLKALLWAGGSVIAHSGAVVKSWSED